MGRFEKKLRRQTRLVKATQYINLSDQDRAKKQAIINKCVELIKQFVPVLEIAANGANWAQRYMGPAEAPSVETLWLGPDDLHEKAKECIAVWEKINEKTAEGDRDKLEPERDPATSDSRAGNSRRVE